MNNKIALVVIYDGIEPDIEVVRELISHFSEANKPITTWVLKNEDVANALLQAACFTKNESKEDREISMEDASLLVLVKTFLNGKTKVSPSGLEYSIMRELLTAKPARQKTLREAIITVGRVDYSYFSPEVLARTTYGIEHHCVIQKIAQLLLDS